MPVFKTQAKVDNWGDPSLKAASSSSSITSPPRAAAGYYEKNIRLPCQQQWKENEQPMSDLLETATAIHSTSSEQYDNFQSTDWIPENKDLYPKGSPWGPKYLFPKNKIKTILASTCHLEEEEITEEGESGKLRQWEITRIGPFVTTGGYDWLQIGWDDLWGMSKILETYPAGVLLVKQYMSPVLKDGTRLGFPPIHIHHIHTGPSPYVRQRGNPVDCTFKGKGCWSPARSAEVHGDYVCTEEDGGHDCHIENYPDG
jgi:hypothetical protein